MDIHTPVARAPAVRQSPSAHPVRAPAAPQLASPHPEKVYIFAYAKDFTLSPAEGEGAALPLEQQRVSGGFSLREGILTVPADGYYMLLWELGVEEAQGSVQLCLGLNGSSAQLTHGLQPGYDSAQQVTWLGAGDKVRLFAKGSGKIVCTRAMLTILQLG